jgi:hypothetical protein
VKLADQLGEVDNCVDPPLCWAASPPWKCRNDDAMIRGKGVDEAIETRGSVESVKQKQRAAGAVLGKVDLDTTYLYPSHCTSLSEEAFGIEPRTGKRRDNLNCSFDGQKPAIAMFAPPA